MINITSQEGPPHTHWEGHSKSGKGERRCCEDAKRPEPPWTAGGHAERCRHFWKTVWHILKKSNIERPYYSAILIRGIRTKETESRDSNKYLCTSIPSSITHESPKGKYPKGPSKDEQTESKLMPLNFTLKNG